MNTLEQKRSAFALAQLAHLKVDQKKFVAEVNSFPSLVLQNGFGQSIAFNLSKKDDQEKQAVVYLIFKWLTNDAVKKLYSKEIKTLLKELSEIPATKYLEAQREALAFLTWVKRYANAGLIGS